MVHKKITVIGSSTDSWEQAALDAVDRVDATVENIKWVEVTGRGIELATTEEPEFQTEVEVAFLVEE
ncbi:MAG: dodecin domain-containing protein [Halobacteriota archaeon]